MNINSIYDLLSSDVVQYFNSGFNLSKFTFADTSSYGLYHNEDP